MLSEKIKSFIEQTEDLNKKLEFKDKAEAEAKIEVLGAERSKLETIYDAAKKDYDDCQNRIFVLSGSIEQLEKQLENKTEITLTENADTISLCAKGIAKHASIPEGSVNAAYLLAKLLAMHLQMQLFSA